MGESLQPDTDSDSAMVYFAAARGFIPNIVLVADIDYYDANDERNNPYTSPKNLAICSQFHVCSPFLMG